MEVVWFTPVKRSCAPLATTHRAVTNTWGRTCVTTQSHGLQSAERPEQVCRQPLSRASSLRNHACAAAIPTVLRASCNCWWSSWFSWCIPRSFRSVATNTLPLMFVENKHTSFVRLFSLKVPQRYSRLHMSPTHLPISFININTPPRRILVWDTLHFIVTSLFSKHHGNLLASNPAACRQCLVHVPRDGDVSLSDALRKLHPSRRRRQYLCSRKPCFRVHETVDRHVTRVANIACQSDHLFCLSHATVGAINSFPRELKLALLSFFSTSPPPTALVRAPRNGRIIPVAFLPEFNQAQGRTIT